MFPAARRALVAGSAILPLAVALGACGGAASSSTGSTSSTGAAAASSAPAANEPAGSTPATSGSGTGTAAGTGIAISVKGTTVTPAPGTVDVKAGDQVTLVITSDRSSEVHVHVVDLEEPIKAGTPLTLTFTPKQTGVYEVELHDPDLLLTKIAVR